MLDAFARAVSLRPEDASWQAELAGHLAQQGRADDAMAAYGRALLIRPDFAEAHLNLGNLYKDTGRLDEALECFDRARKVRPNYHHALSNRLNTIHFHERFGPAELLREARKFDDVFAWPLRGEIRPLTNDRSPDRRLKVGYVSPDFRKHCQSFFTIPLLSHHDHRGFEIYAYAQLAKEDDVTRRIRGYCDVWLNTAGLSDKELADRIRHDEIDILVDLTMHMGDGRPLVFARKPAPVQVAWLAYPGTTGLAAIDYRLTDAYLDPPGERDGFYSERSVRLAHSFWCYDPLGVDVPVNRLPASDAGYVTFGCLSHVCKYSDRALELWGAVLRAVPGSRMIVADATEQHRQRVIKKLGVEAGRIEFQGKLPIPEYLHVYHRIDLGLDAFPYNGHTTSLDSLWMGVPVVSLCGQTAVSRGGWSQLSNLGLGDQFVSRSDEEFVEVSARWARDLAGLAELRGSLRRRMESSPLMDGEGFTRDVESVYRRLWRQWAGAK
jgi:predicted O-linked N-acetylglucosamine transferase (SPINDLY family)